MADLCVNPGGIQTGPFGSQLHAGDYVESGTPIITVEHLGENRVIHKDLPMVSGSDRDRLIRYQMRSGDVIFSRVGSVDCRALVRDTEDGWLFSGRCLRVRPKQDMIDPEYLSYFFGLSGFKRHMRSIAVGATMPSLNTQLLGGVNVYFPGIAEQRAIASILGALDDKIELNRKISRTLDEMVRAVFKSWFLDFNGAAELDESSGLPLGWEVCDLGSVIENLDSRRIPLSGRERAERSGSYPYYGAAGRIDSIDDFIFEGHYVLVGEDGSVVDNRDKPVVQYVWGQFWVNNHAHVLRGRSPVSNEFLYAFLKQVNVRPYVTGAVQPKLNQGNLNRIPVVVPDTDALDAFNTVAGPLFARFRSSQDEAATLAQLRDILLPRLLSGDLRVRDAEAIVDEEV